MARTIGDVGVSAGTVFRAVDANAVTSDKSFHAALARRMVRNSNWLEANVHRVLVHHQFTIDNDPDQATRVDTPLGGDGQFRVRAVGPFCLGPWRVDTLRREIRCKLTVGMANGHKLRYRWELRSEERDPLQSPGGSEWTDLTNSTGATAWVDSVVSTKRAGPGTDWMRLWVQPWPSGLAALPTANDQQGTVNAIRRPSVNANANRGAVPDGLRFASLDVSNYAGPANFTAADFAPNGRFGVTIFRGTLGGTNSTYPAITSVEAGPCPILGTDDYNGNGTNESLLIMMRPEQMQRVEDLLTAGVQLLYMVPGVADVAFRFLGVREKRLTDLSDGQPFREGFIAQDDTAGFTGNTQIRKLLVTAQDNAEMLALGQSQPIVNQRFDLEPDRFAGRESTTLSSATGWTTVAQAGLCLERGYNHVGGTFEFSAESTTATSLDIEARLVVLDDDGAVAASGGAVDIERAQTMLDTGYAAVPTDASWWPGPWWQNGARRMSPELEIDASAYVGTAKALGLQIKAGANFPASVTMTLSLLGWFAVGQARR